MRSDRAIQIVRLGLVCLSVLVGCATPTQRVDKLAAEIGFERKIINSARFQHVVYFNNSYKLLADKNRASLKTEELHIYLEGDGSPWLQRNAVARDPTPRNPLALKLMAKDERASVYIGRPCYFGFSNSSSCSPLFWTHQRYSQVLVDAMVEVANSIIAQQGFLGRVTLIGYSGGGVFAMLMAESVSNTDSVVTVAANLDIDAWANFHKYSQLKGSINPAKQAPLKSAIRQWHLVGKKDENVPPELVQVIIENQLGPTKLVGFDEFDHICCWAEQWQTILSMLK